MEKQTSGTDQRPSEQTPEADEAPPDLPVPASEADRVKGGVVAPCDRSKQ